MHIVKFAPGLMPIAFALSLMLSVTAQAKIYFNAKVMGPVSNIYTADEAGKIEKITDNGIWKDGEFSVAKSGDVVFSSTREDEVKIDLNRHRSNYNIFYWHKNTQKITKITQGQARKFSPKFDPSEKNIAYLKLLDNKHTELRLYNLALKQDTLLVSHKDIFDFDWAPKGNQLAYSYAENDSAAIARITAKPSLKNAIIKPEILVETLIRETSKSAFGKSYLINPSFSPDGSKMAFIRHPLTRGESKSLYMLDLANKRHKLLSQAGQQVQSPLQWHSDGQSILYAAIKDYEFSYDPKLRDKVYKGSMHIYLSELSGKQSIIVGGKHFFGRPVFSGDESRIAYLYAEKLGGASSFILQTIKLDGSDKKILHTSVDKESKLYWP